MVKDIQIVNVNVNTQMECEIHKTKSKRRKNFLQYNEHSTDSKAIICIIQIACFIFIR